MKTLAQRVSLTEMCKTLIMTCPTGFGLGMEPEWSVGLSGHE